jgi:hypothetical protein
MAIVNMSSFAMTTHEHSAEVRSRAREILRRLYDLKVERAGRRLSGEDFFPVDLNSLVRDVLRWKLEEVGNLGFQADCLSPVTGRCEHDSRTIYVAVDTADSERQKRFTLAHEIAHAVLHAKAAGTNRRVISALPAHSRRQRRHAGPERDANIFAEELVMPEKAVRHEFSARFGSSTLWIGSLQTRAIVEAKPLTSSGEDLMDAALAVATSRQDGGRSLADFFGVTPTAMAIRLLRLRLVHV